MTYFIITIDTEEDQWDRYHTTENSVENIREIPGLQALFNRYGAKPTYLINYPVAVDKTARRILKDIHRQGSCEIGMHIHPWNTPPFPNSCIPSGPISVRDTLMCHLPSDIQAAKLKTQFDVIADFLGEAPVSFRCGRWALGPETSSAIEHLGIRVDSSLVPNFNWKPHLDGLGPDFSGCPHRIYRFDSPNFKVITKLGQLLEVPPTVGYLQKYGNQMVSLPRILQNTPFRLLRIAGILNRLNFLNFHWLSPELSNASELIELSQTMTALGHDFLNMSLHSNSLLPGCNSFVKTRGELEFVLLGIESILSYAKQRNMIFTTLREVEAIFPRK